MKLALAQEAELDVAETHTITPQTVNHYCQIELEQVTYTYHSDGDELGFSLGPFSLSLQPGQVTYLVGGNGSGKSTLAKLITGLYPPMSGKVLIDGVAIADHNREWYRQHFSAIFSDFYLFDRCLGCDRPDLDREAKHYLKQLQLGPKVSVRNGVFSTIDLSQGQRKRLALLTKTYCLGSYSTEKFWSG